MLVCLPAFRREGVEFILQDQSYSVNHLTARAAAVRIPAGSIQYDWKNLFFFILLSQNKVHILLGMGGEGGGEEYARKYGNTLSHISNGFVIN